MATVQAALGYSTLQAYDNYQARNLCDFEGPVDSFRPSQAEDQSFLQMRALAREFSKPTSHPQPAGLADFGLGQPERNPKTGDNCWSGNAFGWSRRALKEAGREVSELNSQNSLQAYRKLKKQGKLNFGSPPPGGLETPTPYRVFPSV